MQIEHVVLVKTMLQVITLAGMGQVYQACVDPSM